MTGNLPNSFIERLRGKKVIPFVGAGVSINIKNRQGKGAFPSWFELLSHLENVLKSEGKTKIASDVKSLLNLSEPDYYQVAKIAQNAMGQQWYRFLQTHLDHRIDYIDTNSLTLARAIWKISSPFIITTNYDKSLFWSCSNQDDFSYWDIENIVKQGQLLSNGLPDDPTVWHLHGHIDNPEKIILTLDGYLKLYPGKRRKIEYEAALDTFRSIIKSYSLLFIGFSLSDKFVNEQLIYVNNLYKGSIGPHYILTPENYLEIVEAKNLPIIPITFSDFGQPLVDKINEIADIANERSALVAKAKTDENTLAEKPSQNSPNKRPIHQKLFNFLLPIFLGVTILGTFLDSISNALQLITPKRTYILSGIAIFVLVITYLASKFEWLEWIDENGNKVKLKFEPLHYLQIIGVIILLWVPRIIDHYNPNVESKVAEEKANIEQIKDSDKPSQPINSVVNIPEPVPEETSISELQFANSNKKELAKLEKSRKTVTEKVVPIKSAEIKSEVQLSTARAESLYNQLKYAEAISECNRILSIQPSNKKAKVLKIRIENTMRILNQ